MAEQDLDLFRRMDAGNWDLTQSDKERLKNLMAQHLAQTVGQLPFSVNCSDDDGNGTRTSPSSKGGTRNYGQMAQALIPPVTRNSSGFSTQDVPKKPFSWSGSSSPTGRWNCVIRESRSEQDWTEEEESLGIDKHGIFNLRVVYREKDLYDGLFTCDKEKVDGQAALVGPHKLVKEAIKKKFDREGDQKLSVFQAAELRTLKAKCMKRILGFASGELKLSAQVPVERKWRIEKGSVNVQVVAFVPIKYLPKEGDKMQGSVLKIWREAVEASTQLARNRDQLEKSIDQFSRDLFTASDENCPDCVTVDALSKILLYIDKHKGPTQLVRATISASKLGRIHMDEFARGTMEPFLEWAVNSKDDFDKCMKEVQEIARKHRVAHRASKPSAYIDPWDTDDIRFNWHQQRR